MPNPPSQIWPHLKSGTPSEVEQSKPSLADALFPSLSKSAKQRERDQALWTRINERNRQAMLRGLREWRAERGR
jgi:hypothetical protein